MKTIEDTFFSISRVPHYEIIMGHFPEYLSRHFQLMNSIFILDGPLPLTWRYYIAYIAAASHRCEYLMKLEEELFRLHGRTRWFMPEFEHEIPAKLKLLGLANIKLAHRP